MRFCGGFLPPLAAAIALAHPLAGDDKFLTLFDGKTASGWGTLRGPDFPAAAWRIEDGCLRTIGRGSRADLATELRFRNFEWEFEWKVGEGVNSGVKYLVFGIRPSASGKLDPLVPKALGFELQLADDERVDDARVSPRRSTGALYSFAAPSQRPSNLAPGIWHTGRVIVRASKVEHWLNGVRVLATDLESPELRAAMAAEQREDLPKPSDAEALSRGVVAKYDPGPFPNGNDRPVREFRSDGYPLVLTHHGADAWFRNLRVRKLE
jgi:hypothetical protein